MGPVIPKAMMPVIRPARLFWLIECLSGYRKPTKKRTTPSTQSTITGIQVNRAHHSGVFAHLVWPMAVH